MIVGIDLGTTNSAVAVWQDGKAHLVPNALGGLLTPSAVSVERDGTVLVGAAALERQPVDPHNSATAFKRYMGTQQKTRLGKVDFTAEDLSAVVLRALRADAEAHLGEPVTRAVITVPAYFSDKQRKATRRAGELAGLKVERLVNEPTAAALAFGIQDQEEKAPFLVFDLGGGTFDVSVVEMYEGIVEVRASSGDNRLGGGDFNDAVVALVRDRLDPASKLVKCDPLLVRERLNVAAERARRALSEGDSAPFSLTIGDDRFETEITAEEFEAQAAPLIARLRDPVLRSLRDGGVRVDSLSEIVLVGGATRMPLVRKAIVRLFGRFPNHTVHPDHAVALGAAVQAGLLMRDAALDEIRLSDVCPFTLGVDHVHRDHHGRTREGLFSPIIERNTPIPASRVGSYCTVSDNQREVRFSVYQGEAREVARNIKLGTISIPVPPKPAGHVAVECRFSYDTSGLLEVDVTVPETGVTRSLVIVDEEDVPSPEEIRKRRDKLAALKVHPREEAENVALMARATRCYEAFIGDAREQIGQWIVAFEGVVEGQDPRSIGEARAQLAAALDALESERYL